MVIFKEFSKTQSDQNIHQNAPYFQNFLRGLPIYCMYLTNFGNLVGHPNMKFYLTNNPFC